MGGWGYQRYQGRLGSADVVGANEARLVQGAPAAADGFGDTPLLQDLEEEKKEGFLRQTGKGQSRVVSPRFVTSSWLLMMPSCRRSMPAWVVVMEAVTSLDSALLPSNLTWLFPSIG